MSVLPPAAIEKTIWRPSGEKRGAKVKAVPGTSSRSVPRGDVHHIDARPAALIAHVDELVAARAKRGVSTVALPVVR